MLMLSESQIQQVVLNAKTIAVVGMTDGTKPGRASFEIPQMLQVRGYQLIPVNPMIKTALGEAALGALQELRIQVDICDVFRRAEVIPALADELLALPAELRPKCVWLQTGIRCPE